MQSLLRIDRKSALSWLGEFTERAKARKPHEFAGNNSCERKNSSRDEEDSLYGYANGNRKTLTRLALTVS